MDFRTLVSESTAFLKRAGYLKEAPEDEEEGGSEEESADAGDDLSWMDSEPGATVDAPDDAGNEPLESGSSEETEEPAPEPEETSEPAPESSGEETDESAADKILPEPPAEVLTVKGKLDRLSGIIDKFLQNLDNAEIQKEVSIDEIANNIASILNTDKESVKEVTEYVKSQMSGLIAQLKRLQKLQVNSDNANILGESINALRDFYIYEGKYIKLEDGKFSVMQGTDLLESFTHRSSAVSYMQEAK